MNKMEKRSIVLLLLKRIPKGKVTTYGALAKAARTSPRAVGAIMRSNREPEKFPCYKVVHSDGVVGGYSGPGGRKEKARRLMTDGVIVKNGRVELRRCLFSL